MPSRKQIHAAAIRAQVLRGIAGNRTPGLHFPGYFLDLMWPHLADNRARVAIADGAHCRDADGAIDISVMALLADSALATAARTHIAPGARLATLYMQMQFTGAPARGDIHADARPLGVSEGGALRQMMSEATIFADGKPVCFTNGAFAALDPPEGVKLAPLPWQHTRSLKAPLLAEHELDAHERAILKACDAALAKISRDASFIQNFWGGVPRRTAGGASNRVAIGPHIGNRVGHVQGGISFGIAMNCACAAAPAGMLLSNASAWYIGPGRGRALNVKSRVVHAGRTIAVVRTEIKTAAGERVLEVVSHHVARERG